MKGPGNLAWRRQGACASWHDARSIWAERRSPCRFGGFRSAGADDKAKIVPAIKFSLEEALEYIQKDEYVEVTPNHLRLRKILLKEVDRKRSKAI